MEPLGIVEPRFCTQSDGFPSLGIAPLLEWRRHSQSKAVAVRDLVAMPSSAVVATAGETVLSGTN